MEGKNLGPYRIETELGSGGMGRVYSATVRGRAPGLSEGTKVALKVIHSHLLETPGFFKRFLREAEIGRAVVHENVVRTFDCDAVLADEVQQNFLVMEYVEGQTLRGLLAELEKVPEELCRHIGLEVAKGLAAIHEAGVVHRDIKPENVLITADHSVKIMDLGVARLADEAVRLSRTGMFVGSMEYAAPEQFRSGGADADARADLHALGVMLYELGTGQHPFRDEDAKRLLHRILEKEPRKAGEVNPQLSPFFEEVVQTLMAKDRNARFESAAALMTVLEKGEEGEWWRERAKTLRLETKRPLRRIRIPRETAVYGREEEIAKLRELYEQGKAGEGKVVLIEGEAGIGKSRLVDEFVGRLQSEGEDLNFLFGSYPPGGAATASGAFSAAYREQFGEGGSSSYLPQTPLLVPAFDALLRGDATPTGAQPLTKDSLQTCFVHATRSLAAERPTLVLIDDLHFAPEEGRALFAALALAAPGHRILLVGTTRPGIDEAWASSLQRVDAVRMPLSRLGPKDLTRLLKDAFRSERLAEELAYRIGEKSDGNPFFAFEIIRGLREGQFIRKKEDGTWVSTRGIQDIQIPSSVLDLVNARVAGLAEEERALLDIAACWGYEFDPGLVGEVMGLPRVAALRRFAQIERQHRLVRSAGRNYVFDHHQVQEALYGSLNEQLREECHAALADALETKTKAADADPEALDGALCVDLCEHFLLGARGDRALRYLNAAQEHLVEGYMNAQAIALGEQALAVPGLLEGVERAKFLLRLCDGPLDLLGRCDEERAALNEALALADGTGDKVLRARVRLALGVLHAHTSRWDAAQTALQEALHLANATGDRKLEAQSTRNLGIVCNSLGRYADAQKYFERSLAQSREIGDRQGEALATENIGTALRDLDRYAEARERFELALALLREIGDRRGEANATMNFGILFWNLGSHSEAREHYERSLALLREIGDRRGEAAATMNIGTVLSDLGRYAEAREHHERAEALFREIGHRQFEANAVGSLGILLANLGRYAEAREHYERAIAIRREIGDREGEAIDLVNLGPLQASLGQTGRARDALQESLTASREIGARRVEGYALEDLGILHAQLGETGEARRYYEEALTLRRDLGGKHTIAGTLLGLGRLEIARGEVENATSHLDEALALALETKSPGTSVAASVARARLPGGDVDAALAAFTEHEAHMGHANRMDARFRLWDLTGDKVHLEEAHRLLCFARDHAPEDCRETMIENVPLHRDIMKAWGEHGS